MRTRPTGTWVNGAYTYAAMDDWLDGRAGRPDRAGGRPRARACAGCARSGPARPPTCSGGWAGRSRPPGPRWPTAGRVEVRARRRARLGGSGRRGAGRPRPARGWRCCPGSTRPRWAGRSAAGTSPTRAPRTPSTGWATPARRSGSTGGSSARWVQAAGRRDPHPAASSMSARPHAREVDARAAEVAAMLGETRFTVRFPSPVSAALCTGDVRTEPRLG